MKDIYTIIEETNIEKTDAMYEYMNAYQNCWMLINEKFEFPDFKSMFGGKKQTVSNSASSGFSFLSFLLGGNTSGSKENDPVKAAYMKTLEEKRKNNERRRKELLQANQQMKIAHISMKAKTEEIKTENAHQEMLSQIKSVTDSLNKENANLDKLYDCIRKGKTIPPDILDNEITRQLKTADTLIKSLPDNEVTKAQEAQAAFLKLYYKKNDSGEYVARSPKEFRTECEKNHELRDMFANAAAGGRDFIDHASAEDLENMAKSFDAASSVSQQATATEKLKTAVENAQKTDAAAAAVQNEYDTVKKQNDARTAVKDAKEKLDKANNDLKAIDGENGIAGNKQKTMMYSFISKNKGKEPFKTLLKEKSIADLTNDLKDCVNEDGTIIGEGENSLKAYFDRQTNIPTEKPEDGTDEVAKVEFSLTDQKVDYDDAKKIVEKAKTDATNAIAAADTDLRNKKNALKDVGLSEDDDLKERQVVLSDETKKLLKEAGVNVDDNTNTDVVAATIKSRATTATDAIKNAQKEVDQTKDAGKYLAQKMKDTDETIANHERNKDPEIKDANEQAEEEFKKSGQFNPVVDKKDDKGTYIEYEDENGETKKIYRPTDLSDQSALDMYESKRKLALVKAAGEGKLQEHPTVYAEKVDGKVVYKMKDGDDVVELKNKEEYISGLKAMKAYSRDIATVKNVLKGTDNELTDEDSKVLSDYMDNNEEAVEKIASEFDDMTAAELEDLVKDREGDDDDEEAMSDTEKELRDAKQALKDMSEDDIMDLASKDEKPEDVSDEQWEAAKKYKEAKDKLDNEDEQDDDVENDDDKTTNDENGKPQPPKRKIKKRPSKIKGRFIYIYKTQDNKPARSNKKDWQANVRAWKKYKRRLAKWEKANSTKNESFITKVLAKKLVIERFYPKDLTSYLKECFE